YRALMGADEEATDRDLKAHQAVILPMVAEHGGRVIDTAGEGILAEFGAVLDAVKCALVSQKTMADRNTPGMAANATRSADRGDTWSARRRFSCASLSGRPALRTISAAARASPRSARRFSTGRGKNCLQACASPARGAATGYTYGVHGTRTHTRVSV